MCRVNRRHQTMYLKTHRSSRRGLIGDLLLFMCWTYSLCCTYACNALVVDTLNSNLMLVLWYDICVPLWIIVTYVMWCVEMIYICDICAVKHICAVIYICVLGNVMQKQKKFRFLRLCRVLWPRHSANMKYLPSVGIITLGEKLFLKKPNTVCKMFAECLPARHSAYYYHLLRAALGDKEF